MDAAAPDSPDFHIRLPEPFEWVPEDYFRRARIEEIFPHRPEGPLEVDLGCGDGTFLAGMAGLHPSTNFLGVERLLGRIRKCSRKAQRGGLSNVRLLRLESEYTIQWLLPEESVAKVHLLFPDPWPKKRHHERRIFRSDFLPHVSRVLEPGGEFLFKTDHEGYYEWALEVAEAADGWERLPWEGDEFAYPVTDFEDQWMKQGKAIQRLRLRKRKPAA